MAAEGKKIKNAGVRENIRVELVKSKNKLYKKRVERVIHIFWFIICLKNPLSVCVCDGEKIISQGSGRWCVIEFIKH